MTDLSAGPEIWGPKVNEPDTSGQYPDPEAIRQKRIAEVEQKLAALREHYVGSQANALAETLEAELSRLRKEGLRERAEQFAQDPKDAHERVCACRFDLSNECTCLADHWEGFLHRARLRNEQPKGSDRALCPDCGASYEETPILTTPKNPCLTCGAPLASPSPSPEPQDVREALLAAKRTLAAYQKQGAPHTFVGDISLQKVHALIDAAIAQSDAQPVGWQASARAMEGHNEACYYCGLNCDLFAGDPGMWPIPLCHKDEPGVVKWHHIECVSARLVETAPPRPDASGLIEAAELAELFHGKLKGATEAEKGPPYTALHLLAKQAAFAFKSIAHSLRSRAADRSAPRSDKGGA